MKRKPYKETNIKSFELLQYKEKIQNKKEIYFFLFPYNLVVKSLKHHVILAPSTINFYVYRSVVGTTTTISGRPNIETFD